MLANRRPVPRRSRRHGKAPVINAIIWGNPFASPNQCRTRATSLCGVKKNDPTADKTAANSIDSHTVALTDNAASTGSYAAVSTDNGRTASRHIGSREQHSLLTSGLTLASCRVPDPGAGTDPGKRTGRPALMRSIGPSLAVPVPIAGSACPSPPAYRGGGRGR